MLWRISFAAALFGIQAALAATSPGIIQVTSLRSWSHPESTRVIVETTGPFEYRSDHAVNPDRLYFDILHSRPWISQRRYTTREIGDHLVHRVRIAEKAPGTTRIVFDLVNPADYTVTRLDSPDRMVIELRPLHHAPPAPLDISSLSNERQFVFPPAPRRAVVSVPPAAPAISAATEPMPFVLADAAISLNATLARLTSPRLKALQTASARAVPTRSPVATELTPLTPPVFQAAVAPAKTTVAPPIAEPVLPPSLPTSLRADTSPLASQNASRSLTRALGLKINRIVIDAGHGGHDDGTIGPHGVLEKDVVLDVALRLSKLVQERMGTEVVLTRADDTFIPLRERTAIANNHKSDLFLSIHANSSPAPEVAGTETFFLNFTNSPGALEVAARENAGSDKTVGELKDLIQTITLNDKIEESHTFAQDIENAIQAQAAKSNSAARSRGVKRAPFVVLIGASMPSVLAEIGFLSNSRDEANLGKPEYRQKVAEALYKGLSEYAQSLSHFEPGRQVATKTTAGLN